MRVIDLLNKIANSEEIPKKIKVFNYIFIYTEDKRPQRFYKLEEQDNYLLRDFIYTLNTEVEIIEEETKPLAKESFEALGYALGSIQKCINNGYDKALKNKPFIDEDNEIIPLDIHQEKNCKNNWKWKCNGYNISTPQKIIGEKLNEVIIKLNKMEEIIK